jgi:hypothetical protein
MNIAIIVLVLISILFNVLILLAYFRTETDICHILKEIKLLRRNSTLNKDS